MNTPSIFGLSTHGKRFILGEILPRRWQFVGLVVLSVIAGVVEMLGVGLVFPLIMVIVSPSSIDSYPPLKWLADELGVGRGRGLMLLLTALIAGIMISKNLYMVGFNWVQQRVLATWKSQLSARLMRIYIFSEYQLYLEKSSSEFIRNISLTAAIFDQFMTGIINLTVNGVILLALAILLVMALPPETFIGLIVLTLAAIGCYLALKGPFQRIGEELNALFKTRQSILRQSIGLIKETRIMAKERYFLDRFVEVEKRNFNRNAHFNFLSSIPPLIIEAMAILAILGLVSYILFRTGGEPAGLATLGLLAAALFRAIPLLNRIMTALQLINISSNAVEIVSSELDELESAVSIPVEDVPALPFEKSLRLDNVAFSYPSSTVRALHQASLEIHPNEFIGITGPSGSGKSTLAAIMLGLVPPTSGRVLVDGVDIGDPSSRRGWQKQLGFVAQGAMLVEDTIANNVAFGADPADIDIARIWSVLEMVQLKDFIKGLPGQIDYFLGEDGVRFSGGQRQRLGIARALYRDPKVLVMDEATSALDVATEQAFSAALNRLRGTRTMIIMAHRLSTLKGCDRVVMLTGGNVIDVAPFDILEQRCPEFRRLVELSNLEHTA